MLACVVWTLSISHVLRQVCAGLNVPCPCLLTISRLKFHSRGVQLVPSDCEEEAVSACTCLEHVFSLQLYLTGNRILLYFFMIAILVFCMFHVLLLSLFLKFRNYSQKKFIGAFEGKSFKMSFFNFFNFHFKWGWVVCALWASATRLWWGEIMRCIACLKMAKSIF